MASYAVALLFTTWAILSIGFVIASIVPTARFAQPIATFIVYPMLGVSGLFYPIDRLPPALQMLANRVAAHLRGVAPERNLEGRVVARTWDGRGRAGADLRDLHGDLVESL